MILLQESVFLFPVFKIGRVIEVEFAFLIQENLYGFSCCGKRLSRITKYFVAKMNFCRLGSHKFCFYNYCFTVFQRHFVFAMRFDNGRCIAIIVHLQVIKPVFCSKSFAPVFKVFDKISMPYNAEGISIAETDFYFGTGNKVVLLQC